MKWRLSLGVSALIVAMMASLSGCTPRNSQGDVSPQSASVWTQSTASDFKKGVLERIQVRREGDGELTLAQNAQALYETSGVYTSPPCSPPAPFSAAIWQWKAETPEGTTLILSVRTSLNGKDWTEWQESAPDADLRSADSDWPGHLIIVGEARFLQYRLQFAGSGAATPVVASVTWTFTDARPGPTVQEAMQMVVPQGEGPGIRRPAIIPRRGWGANESLMTWPPEYETPVKIIIHHTVTPNTAQDFAAVVRSVYYYHAVTRGWGDVGYNFLIDPLGNIYEGRAGGESVVGGHDFGFNEGSVGIALLGDYQTETPAPAMMNALVQLMAYLCDHHQIDPTGRSVFRDRDLANIVGHRETKSTTCPGDQLQSRIPALRESVQDAIQQEAPSVRIVSPKAGAVLSGETMIQVRGGLATADITLYIDNKLVLRKIGASLDYNWDTQKTPDGDHQLKAIAHNPRGEEALQTLLVLVDNTAPGLTLIVNGGRAYANQQAVTLTLEAFDVGSGLEAMQIVQGNDPALAPAQPYQREVSFTLADQIGPQNISARVADKAGLRSRVSQAQIYYDPNPPHGWSGAAQSNAGEVTVRVVDVESGLDLTSAAVMTSTDGGLTWSVWNPAATTPGEEGTASLSAKIDEYVTSVRLQIADKAGNVAQSPVYTIPCQGCPAQRPSPSPAPLPTAPDLVIASLEIFPPKPEPGEPVLFRVKVRNQGTEAADGFWVQLYLDPSVEPYVNLIASQVGTGIFWYVETLAPGEEITLSSANPYPLYSNYSGNLASGMHKVYVLADAYHTEGANGLVHESSESNNLYGPVTINTAGSSPFSWSSLEEWLSRWLHWNP